MGQLSMTRIDRPFEPSDLQFQWGATKVSDGRWRFAIWAPAAQTVELVLNGSAHPTTYSNGWYWAEIPAEVGDTYTFRINGNDRPDPAARFQSGDVHGPSVVTEVMPPPAWDGMSMEDLVIYELHVGTFTDEGTFKAATAELERLAGLGFTAIELMPLSQFEGNRGWGYDGVLIGAPHNAYGSPDDLVALVTKAHEIGISVILDLVMNHFGPSGNYIGEYCPEFFHQTDTPWGAGIDFSRDEVRHYFGDIAIRWLEDYGFDGLRLDAVHQISEEGHRPFLISLIDAIRAKDWGRPIHMITEDERNLPHLRDAGYDAEWNDDYHHTVHCTLTGEDFAYYEPFAHDPIGDLKLALERGQVNEGQKRPAGEPMGASAGHLPWSAFVNSNQTHDQIGNRAGGERLIALSNDAAARVLHTLLLCSPFTPMLFMGEEVGSTAPFNFFVDFEGDLAKDCREGRARELASIGHDASKMSDPTDPETAAASYPFRPEDTPHRADWEQLTKDLLAFRKEKTVPILKSGEKGLTDAEQLGEEGIYVAWPFKGGQICIALRLQPQNPELRGKAGPFPDHMLHSPDFAVGDLTTDPYAIAVKVIS